jgi:S1-C subfamily serine protease
MLVKYFSVYLFVLALLSMFALLPSTFPSLQVGQRCYAIGNPFSLDRALTQGIVSGLGRELGAGMGPLGGLPLSISDAIQTDVALNPGNSGGPLLDSNGRVVGVSCAILDPSGRGVNSGVGFAISIDSVRGLIDQVSTTVILTPWWEPVLSLQVLFIPVACSWAW